MAKLLAPDVQAAKELLEARGFTVLRAETARRSRERLRVAEALHGEALLQVERTEQWAQRAFAEQHRLARRCERLYGLAARYGATDYELHKKTDEADYVS